MPRPCSICTHKKRVEIDRAILRGVAYNEIARQFGVGADAVSNHHKKGHVTRQMKQAAEKRELIDGAELVAELFGLIARLKRIMAKAEASGSPTLELKGVREFTNTARTLSDMVFKWQELDNEKQRLERRDQGPTESWEEQKEQLRKLGRFELDLLHLLSLKMHHPRQYTPLHPATGGRLASPEQDERGWYRVPPEQVKEDAEVLERYERELRPRLESLLREYSDPYRKYKRDNPAERVKSLLKGKKPSVVRERL